MKNNKKKKRRQRIRKMSQFFLISLCSTPFTHKNHSRSNLLFHFSSSKLRNFGFASSYRCEIDVLFRIRFSFLSYRITQHDLCVNKEFALGFIPISLGREMRSEIFEWMSWRKKDNRSWSPGRFEKIDILEDIDKSCKWCLHYVTNHSDSRVFSCARVCGKNETFPLFHALYFLICFDSH